MYVWLAGILSVWRGTPPAPGTFSLRFFLDPSLDANLMGADDDDDE